MHFGFGCLVVWGWVLLKFELEVSMFVEQAFLYLLLGFIFRRRWSSINTCRNRRLDKESNIEAGPLRIPHFLVIA